jgi:prepilin-type N-terminal cleavage/methylation domain-containing protein
MPPLIRTNPRRAFTLIELLVVISIIGILIGLILPAVLAAREAANVVKCKNNLKQLGTAAQLFVGNYGHLPPGIGYYPTPNSGDCVIGTSSFHLLPYLEQRNLYDDALGLLDLPAPDGPTMVRYPGNNSVYSRTVAVFLCPSDSSVGPGGKVSIRGVPFGAMSYAINSMLSGARATQQGRAPGPQGKTCLSDIPDGLSNTILYAEKYARCSNKTMVPAFQSGGSAWAYCTSPAFPWLPPPMDLPMQGFQPGFAIAALANFGAPNAIREGSIFQVQPSPENCDPTRASTPHAAGIQVCLVDCSVRTLRPTMSRTTWWHAVTPSGGEILGADWNY